LGPTGLFEQTNAYFFLFLASIANMLTEQKHSDLVSAIYDAALDFERWPSAIELLADVLGATGGSLVRQDFVTGKGAMFNARTDPQFSNLYDRYYHKLNVLPKRAGSRRVGSCLTDRTILPKEEFIRTEFYNDYLKPFKVQGVLKVYLHVDEAYEGYLSFGSSSTRHDWEAEHVELLGSLAAHLVCAAQVNRKLESTRLINEGALDVLGRLSEAVAITDGNGRPVLLNQAAASLIAEADGIAVKNRRLQVGNRSETTLLQKMIAAASRGEVRSPEASTLMVSRPSRRRAYRLFVASMRRTRSWLLSETCGAIIFIRDPESVRPPADKAYLRGLYGLTPTETDLAVELMQGGRLTAAAEALGIATSTARSHLKRIFDKTGARRQAELVHLATEISTGIERRRR
jgi:DNA-binding CsgD family transcriptional regulator